MPLASTVPLGTAHVGCVTTAPLATGKLGLALIVYVTAVELHPPASVTVKSYVPAAKPVNTPVPFVCAATAGVIPVNV